MTSSSGMHVAPAMLEAIGEICKGLEAGKEQAFWNGIEGIISRFGGRNRELLQKRDVLQQKIDTWHKAHRDVPAANLGKHEGYVAMLKDIGYLVPHAGFTDARTASVDPEIGLLAGAQLVCPIDKARFVLNSINARWGSMFDAVYSSNIIGGAAPEGPWSEARAQETFVFVDNFFSECFPLQQGDWSTVDSFAVQAGSLSVNLKGGATSLKKAAQFVGFTGKAAEPSSVLLKQNGLHIEILLDRSTKLGRVHHAGMSDVMCEAAVTTILDMEDSVSVVDAEDKAVCYRNLASVMRGDLKADLGGGKMRVLAKDRGPFTAPDGRGNFALSGRACPLVRNVGLSMYTDAVMFKGEEVPEHFLDAMATALCACHDFRQPAAERNLKAGSVYIVKPKMHGPEEVAMVVELFEAVEEALGLPALTMKIGVMDEERRTTVNLPSCISVAADRICFINTGFMDRVGDEIHTSIHLGPAFPKALIKQQTFFQAYEDHNVLCGLQSKFHGKAQIGKGMWAEPDNLAGLLKAKRGHPQAGANCAWVPSPVGGTVHAMHYHMVDVFDVQRTIKHAPRDELLARILSPPVMSAAQRPSATDIAQELEESAQSILGYVVRWVEQGVGCSKVPDYHNVQLMEDRATLRISSQLLASWIQHGVITDAEFERVMRKMAAVVDAQNAGDKDYVAMTPSFQTLGFQAGLAIVREGVALPNGLTEPVLHTFRRKAKAARSSRM